MANFTFFTQSLAKMQSFSSFLRPLQGFWGFWFSISSSSNCMLSDRINPPYCFLVSPLTNSSWAHVNPNINSCYTLFLRNVTTECASVCVFYRFKPLLCWECYYCVITGAKPRLLPFTPVFVEISMAELRGLSCSVCYNDFKSDEVQFVPRNLICGHTYCTGILLFYNLF